MATEERWVVEVLSAAATGLQRILEKHGDGAFDEALDDLLALEEDPTPPGSKHMEHTREHYRIYIYRSLYRAVYRVLPGKRKVLVEDIGPRSSVYLEGGYERW